MPQKLRISKEELGKILRDFKVEAYAGGGKYLHAPYGTQRYIRINSPWSFIDEYDGDACFGGMERLIHKAPGEDAFGVWHMVYSGRTLDTKIPQRKVYDFLREALKAVPIDLPFRGPIGDFESKKPEFKDFVYTNYKSRGEDLTFASGCEGILHDYVEIYEGFWTGGLLMENLDDIVIV